MPKKLTKNPSFLSSTSSSAAAGAAAAASSASAPGGPTTSSAVVLPAVLTDGQPLPRLVVFDLDYTLWPFWVDTHVLPPLRANAAHDEVTDKVGETFAFFADVPGVLMGLSLAGVRLAVASRTSAPDLGREMLRLLHVGPASSVLETAPAAGTDGGASGGSGGTGATTTMTVTDPKKEKARKSFEFFDSGMEIYPSSKIRHFEAIQKRTGIPYTEMLFFDDEPRNRDTESLGVMMWLVRDGVTWHEVDAGIAAWRRRRQLHAGQ